MTGSAKDGGGAWDKEVYIRLIGSHAESGKVKLTDSQTTMEGSFRRKKYDDLVIESHADLGEVLVVIIGNEHKLLSFSNPRWYVDFVIVHNFQSKANEDFPCYHWIGPGDHVSCTAHTSKKFTISIPNVLANYESSELIACTIIVEFNENPEIITT